MRSKINKLLKEIDSKKKELLSEYKTLREKYNFEYIKWKIIFSKKQRIENKKSKKSILKTIFKAEVREILSAPFIYMMIIPAVILDLFLFLYQNTAIRLYKIPLVKRSDYIKLDRKQLDYLNLIEKFNCLYCSYVNWLFSYAVEIGGRTERYWCPIKYANNKKWWHYWERYFSDYGDAKWFRDIYGYDSALKDLSKKKD